MKYFNYLNNLIYCLNTGSTISSHSPAVVSQLLLPRQSVFIYLPHCFEPNHQSRTHHPVISWFSSNERLDPGLFCTLFHLVIVYNCNFLDLQNYLFESTNMQFMAQFKWVLICLFPLTSAHICFQNRHWNRQNLKNLATNKNNFKRN